MENLKLNNKILIENYIKSQSYQKEFKDFMLKMLDKYDVDIFNLNGIGEQLDINKAIKRMVNANSVANGSIDSNANAGKTTAITIMHEIAKPHALMQSYYRIWKWLKKNRSLEKANNFIEYQISGAFYVNDMHYISYPMSYCYNHSCLNIAMQGLVGIDTNDTLPPKYLRSYFDIIEAYLLIAGNATAGATGISNLLVVASVFLKKMIQNDFTDSHTHLESEDDCWTHFKEELTSFIYRVNQACRGNQSLFTNVSIFDKYFLENIIAETELIIDGKRYGTDIDTVNKVQEIYLDIMNEEAERTVHTFPVTTACFSTKVDEETGKTIIQDKDFLDFICKKNEARGFINIFGGDTSILSSCCFDGEQEVLVKDSKNGVRLISFIDLMSELTINRPNLKVMNNGAWSSARVIKVPRGNKKMFNINTVKHQHFICTEDHMLLTDRGEIRADELKDTDYLLMSTLTLPVITERDERLTYEQGVLVGAYLGDGNIYRRKDNNGCELTLSLNDKKVVKLESILKEAIRQIAPERTLRINPSVNNVVFAKVNGVEIGDFIERWCITGHAENKNLNLNVLCQTEEFRKGILDGLHATDGHSEYNIVYTSSEALMKSIECLIVSLGGFCNISVDTRVDEPIVIRGQEHKRNNLIYHIRFMFNRHKKIENILKVKHNQLFIKVNSIEQIKDYNKEFVYCMEMADEEDHYFTLPNGIHLSNCRLRSDASNKFFNSFGGASDSIGSSGVVCINLPQLAYKNKDSLDNFKIELKTLVDLAQDINYAKRCLLKASIKKGHLPLYSNDYMDLTKQFSTLGFIGIYEACEILGYDIVNEDGLKVATDILSTMEQYNNEFAQQYKIPCNLEGIPGENTCVKLAAKDKILGYNNDYTMYSNQFIPLSKSCNLLDRILLSSSMDKYCSGGSIMHITVDNKISLDTMKELTKNIIESGVKYFAFNYEINQCKNCNKIFVGKAKECPNCNSTDIDRYMRVVGFLTKKSDWSDARQAEDRQYYNF